MESIFLKLFLICWFLKLTNANITMTPFNIKATPMFYIAGGNREPSTLKLVNYMVSIRSRNPQRYFGDNHFCAGTIISKRAVLTSAHCVMDKRRVLTRARRLLLVAGTPNRLLPIETTVQFPAKSLTANTNFIRNNKDDIAIIHLKGVIPEDNENIRIIKMPTGPPPYDTNCTIIGWGRMIRGVIPEDNENIRIIKMPTGPPPYDTNCTIIGWGRMIRKGPLAALPLQVNVRLYQPSECKSVLHEHYHEGILCAGDSVNYDEDPCRGDSGGPLICNDELTGVISWTIGCGTHRLPSLYTDVWHNREWIEKHLNTGFRVNMENYLMLILILEVFIF